jgi:hypothetical protein
MDEQAITATEIYLLLQSKLEGNGKLISGRCVTVNKYSLLFQSFGPVGICNIPQYNGTFKKHPRPGSVVCVCVCVCVFMYVFKHPQLPLNLRVSFHNNGRELCIFFTV